MCVEQPEESRVQISIALAVDKCHVVAVPTDSRSTVTFSNQSLVSAGPAADLQKPLVIVALALHPKDVKGMVE